VVPLRVLTMTTELKIGPTVIDGRAMTEGERLKMLADEEHAALDVMAEWIAAGKRSEAERLSQLAQRACDKAARDAALTGEAVLIWHEGGKFHAKNIDLNTVGAVRESVPEHLRRRYG
jgi:hypothetical protein